MFPGQLRPTFESYDRAKRAAMTVLAVLWGVGFIATFRSPYWVIFPALLVAELIVVQIVYARRLNAVRKVAANLQHQFPADRFLVGNARFVGSDDRDVGSVEFATVILQIDAGALSLWKPGVGSSPFLQIPRAGSTIDVVESRPPRVRVVGPRATSTTYLALFTNSGLGYEPVEQLREFARDYGTR